MTKEEAIEKIKRVKGLYAYESDYEALDMAIEALSCSGKPNGWVSCSEMLPEKEGHYLVYAPYYSGGSSGGKESHDGVMFSRFKNGKWSIEHGYHKRLNCVKAWMPIPKP